jgi:hypothetical protein
VFEEEISKPVTGIPFVEVNSENISFLVEIFTQY